MKKSVVVFVALLFGVSSLWGVNASYLKTKIKNRARVQEKTGAFKHSKYKYVSERELKEARYKTNPNLGVVDVKRGEYVRDANVYIESNSRIRLHNNKGSKVQVGVVNVARGARLKSADVTVKANNGIEIRQQKGSKHRVSQVGVVNMRKSSQVKQIRTRVETKKDIRIKNY